MAHPEYCYTPDYNVDVVIRCHGLRAPASFTRPAETFRYAFMTNNTWQTVAARMFATMPNLEQLDLSGNRLKSLNPRAFDGLVRLSRLNLARNQIISLDERLFSALAELESLDLGRNRILQVHSRSFGALRRLTRIQLNDNRIRALDGNVFGQNHKLMSVYLNDNDLERIARGTFADVGFNAESGKLILARNRITEIADGAFAPSASLHELDLRGNPVHCALLLDSSDNAKIANLPEAVVHHPPDAQSCRESETRTTAAAATHVASCENEPCQNGGSCQEETETESGVVECACAGGYGGRFCEEDVDECEEEEAAERTCPVGEECLNNHGSYACSGTAGGGRRKRTPANNLLVIVIVVAMLISVLGCILHDRTRRDKKRSKAQQKPSSLRKK